MTVVPNFAAQNAYDFRQIFPAAHFNVISFNNCPGRKFFAEDLDKGRF